MKPIRPFILIETDEIPIALITRADVVAACKRKDFVPDESDEIQWPKFETALQATLDDSAARADVQDFLYDAVMELAGKIEERMEHV